MAVRWPVPATRGDNPGAYVSQSGRLGILVPVGATSSAATRQAATFTFVPGLADPRCYSLGEDGAELPLLLWRT
ncbi:AbfB domain-containing protein [Streptomyces sp. NPDC006365]|uniref:AbfB domain-containing protein n=1 Tax=Streptomyces sp. NPDC006365 TaxID=3364744 RepID=UPI00369C9E5B